MTVRLFASAAALLALTGGAALAQDTTTTPPVAPAAPDAPARPTTPTDAAPMTVAQSDSQDNRFRFGPTVGIFLPTSGKTKDRFGSTWLSVGLGVGPVGHVPQQGQILPDINFYYHSAHGNRAFVAPLGIQYRVAGSGTEGVKEYPYFGVSADVLLADVKSDQDKVGSGLRTGAAGSLFAGINFGDSAYVEARYYGMTKVKDFDFSGLNLVAGYRF